MQVKFTVHCETDDLETINDGLKILETTLPYMFDNVVVTYKEIESEEVEAEDDQYS